MIKVEYLNNETGEWTEDQTFDDPKEAMKWLYAMKECWGSSIIHRVIITTEDLP